MRSLLESLFALMLLVLLSPLLATVAVAIVMDDFGSPFYLAPRTGRGGREFRMWKFRTMVVNAAAIGPAITGRSDPRITRIGKRLRRSKLDELPQLVNVVSGDMSLIGPRPESPALVASYSPEQRRVLDVKPGITGPVQLAAAEESDAIPHGARAETYYRKHLMNPKLQSDLDYLSRRTCWSDLRVVLETFAFMVRSLANLGNRT